MNYKKYLNKLREDTSIEELERYVSGEKQFNQRATTKEQRKELTDKLIPAFIKQIRTENEKDLKYWHNAPIFRVAYQYCVNKCKPVSDIFDVVIEISDRTNKDDTSVAVKQRLYEYWKRTKNVEII